MKRLLLLIVPFLMLFVGCDKDPYNTERQTIHANEELWKLQKQFGFTQVRLTVEIERVWNMQKDGCEDAWGCADISKGAIRVMDIRDMPMSMPWGERSGFQNEVLQHEVMHFKLEELHVPGEVQDELIHALQPSMVKP